MFEKLVTPQRKYSASWQIIVEKFRHDAKSIGLWKILGDPGNIDLCISNAGDYSQGRNLPSGWVPCSMFWMIDGDDIVGIVNIRHQLNESLFERGGHIGYEIVPSERNKGYGKKILALSIIKAKEIGIHKILITSFEDNIASRKIIEANGGKLENKIIASGEDKPTCR